MGFSEFSQHGALGPEDAARRSSTPPQSTRARFLKVSAAYLEWRKHQSLRSRQSWGIPSGRNTGTGALENCVEKVGPVSGFSALHPRCGGLCQLARTVMPSRDPTLLRPPGEGEHGRRSPAPGNSLTTDVIPVTSCLFRSHPSSFCFTIVDTPYAQSHLVLYSAQGYVSKCGYGCCLMLLAPFIGSFKTLQTQDARKRLGKELQWIMGPGRLPGAELL